MRAMVLDHPRTPLVLSDLADPAPGAGQLRLRVRTCAICRTDLHVIDGELPRPKRPLVPGHEIVGVVDAIGDGVTEVRIGERRGVPWLGWTCGECFYCRRGQENLCDRARFTGYDLDGGYAELVVADARFCFPLPVSYSDAEAAPLLCAGLIGYRSLRAAGDAERLALYGFGAAAHIVAQIARHEGRRVFAFTRPGDRATQEFARGLGVAWSGGTDQQPPEEIDAAIIFAPAGELVPLALRAVRKAGAVVCAGIHMSDIPSFPYEILWGERVVRSVANLTRADGSDFLALAAGAPILTHTTLIPLAEANEGLDMVRRGEVRGAVVLDIDSATAARGRAPDGA